MEEQGNQKPQLQQEGENQQPLDEQHQPPISEEATSPEEVGEESSGIVKSLEEPELSVEPQGEIVSPVVHEVSSEAEDTAPDPVPDFVETVAPENASENQVSNTSTEGGPTDAGESAPEGATTEPHGDSTEMTVENPEVTPASTGESTESPSTLSKEGEGGSAGEEFHEEDIIQHHEEEEHHEEVHYDELSKEELLEALKELRSKDIAVAASAMKAIKNAFDSQHREEEQEAFVKFKEEDGETADFEYRVPKVSAEFYALFEVFQKEVKVFFEERDRSQQALLTKKENLLEELRNIIDGEEDESSYQKVRDLQQTWREVGSLPARQGAELHANYRALISRFYNNRSIYFELKELDRKKNLEAKEKLCLEAEGLIAMESIGQALARLNELHEEYKDLGPVPRDVQEALWNRFKAASTALYDKRAEFTEQLKVQLEDNYKKKLDVVDRVKTFSLFASDRIVEWKAKTDDIKKIQAEWKEIGAVPRNKAKEITKSFWQHSKNFFANKSAFFKELDRQKEENLKKKEALCEKAEALKESDDYKAAADALKQLQVEWKEVGPVPKKVSDEVYGRFRAACDYFFNRRRESNKERDQEYLENLHKKKEVLVTIADLAADDLDGFTNALDDFNAIGFVPRDKKKEISALFKQAAMDFLDQAQGDTQEIDALKMEVELGSLKGNPNARTIIQKKKSKVRNKINQLQGEMDTIQRNIEFFAHSKNLGQIKADAERQIEEAKSEIKVLKKELRVLDQF